MLATSPTGTGVPRSPVTPRPSPTATTMTSPPTLPSCARNTRASWSAPATGTRLWLSVSKCWLTGQYRRTPGSGDRNSIVPVRLARAEALWLSGDLENAGTEAELADDMADGCDEWDRGAVAVWLRRTGSARSPRGAVAAPFQRELAADWEAAARLWTDLGCPYEAGLALLGATAEAPLRQALRIFTGLGARATAAL